MHPDVPYFCAMAPSWVSVWIGRGHEGPCVAASHATHRSRMRCGPRCLDPASGN